MNRLILLFVFLAGCATGPFNWKRNLRSNHPPHNLSHSPPDCGGRAEACFTLGQKLVQADSTRSEGVKTLFAACGAGSDPACDLLQQHAKPPRPLDELAPPGYPRAALEHNESGLLLIKCRLPETGVLADCRAIHGLPQTAPAFLRWLRGKKMIPLTYDGKPVAVDYVIPFRIVAP